MANVQDIDVGSVRLVRKELDACLKRARDALETRVREGVDSSAMTACVTALHEVDGVLRMLQLHGAALLSSEMEKLASIIAGGATSAGDEAFEALMRAILQLPSYLDQVVAGHSEVVTALTPLIDDLRRLRGAPGLELEPPPAAEIPPLPRREIPSNAPVGEAIAIKARRPYQLALLNLMKGQDPGRQLAVVAKITSAFVSYARNERVYEFWWLFSGVLEALKDGGLKLDMGVKRLFARVERELKQLSESSEAQWQHQVDGQIFNDLADMVADSSSTGSRVSAIKQRLAALKPPVADPDAVARVQQHLSGVNHQLMETVAAAIRDDLARVKDGLDLFKRGDSKDIGDLERLIDPLRKVTDTLAMLGLDVPRAIVQEKRAVIEGIISGKIHPTDRGLMELASALLFVESVLSAMAEDEAEVEEDAFGGQVLESLQRVRDGDELNEQEDVSSEVMIPGAEYRQIVHAVIQESKTDISRAKEAIVSFLQTPDDHSILEEVPELFAHVRGGLMMLEMARASDHLEAIAQYVQFGLLKADAVPEQASLEALADAISAIEYYLEAVGDGRRDNGTILDVGQEALARLGHPWPDEWLADDLASSSVEEGADGTAEAVDLPERAEVLPLTGAAAAVTPEPVEPERKEMASQHTPPEGAGVSAVEAPNSEAPISETSSVEPMDSKVLSASVPEASSSDAHDALIAAASAAAVSASAAALADGSDEGDLEEPDLSDESLLAVEALEKDQRDASSDELGQAHPEETLGELDQPTEASDQELSETGLSSDPAESDSPMAMTVDGHSETPNAAESAESPNPSGESLDSLELSDAAEDAQPDSSETASLAGSDALISVDADNDGLDLAADDVELDALIADLDNAVAQDSPLAPVADEDTGVMGVEEIAGTDTELEGTELKGLEIPDDLVLIDDTGSAGTGSGDTVPEEAQEASIDGLVDTDEDAVESIDDLDLTEALSVFADQGEQDHSHEVLGSEVRTVAQDALSDDDLSEDELSLTVDGMPTGDDTTGYDLEAGILEVADLDVGDLVGEQDAVSETRVEPVAEHSLSLDESPTLAKPEQPQADSNQAGLSEVDTAATVTGSDDVAIEDAFSELMSEVHDGEDASERLDEELTLPTEGALAESPEISAEGDDTTVSELAQGSQQLTAQVVVSGPVSGAAQAGGDDDGLVLEELDIGGDDLADHLLQEHDLHTSLENDVAELDLSDHLGGHAQLLDSLDSQQSLGSAAAEFVDYPHDDADLEARRQDQLAGFGDALENDRANQLASGIDQPLADDPSSASPQGSAASEPEQAIAGDVLDQALVAGNSSSKDDTPSLDSQELGLAAHEGDDGLADDGAMDQLGSVDDGLLFKELDSAAEVLADEDEIFADAPGLSGDGLAGISDWLDGADEDETNGEQAAFDDVIRAPSSKPSDADNSSDSEHLLKASAALGVAAAGAATAMAAGASSHEPVDTAGLNAPPEGGADGSGDETSIESEPLPDYILQPVAADADPDIMEIFIEEAEEELESVQAQFPAWRGNVGDSAALTSIRRSFHTLKGSGRLAGAVLMGEFAWAHEQLLNAVIEGDLNADERLFGLLALSIEHGLPELVAQLHGEALDPREGFDFQSQIERADALREGREFEHKGAQQAGVLDDVQDGVGQETASLASDEPAVPSVSSAGDRAGSEDEDSSIESESFSTDRLDEETSTHLPSTHQPSTHQSPTLLPPTDLPLDPEPYEPTMDPVLAEIFVQETAGHLEAIYQFVDQARIGGSLRISESLKRALHTLQGSAHMAGVAVVADVAGAMDVYAKYLDKNQMQFEPKDLDLLQRAADQVEAICDGLSKGGDADASVDALVAEISARFVSRSNPVVSVPTAPTTGMVDEPDAVLPTDSDQPSSQGEATSSSAMEMEDLDFDASDAADFSDALSFGDDSDDMAWPLDVEESTPAVDSSAELELDDDHGAVVETSSGAASNAGDELGSALEVADELANQEAVATAESQEPPVADAGQALEVEESIGASLLVADPELLEIFLQEAEEILDAAERSLESWREDLSNMALVAELQRGLHTLKGGARMAAITSIADLSHALEFVFTAVAEQQLKPDESMIGHVHLGFDRLVQMIESVRASRVPETDAALVEGLERVSRVQPFAQSKDPEDGSDKPLGTEAAAVAEEPVQSGHSENQRDSHPQSVDDNASGSPNHAADQAPLPTVADGEAEGVGAVSESASAPTAKTFAEAAGVPRQDMLRVDADMLGGLVNMAGEVTIYRSRLEQKLGQFQFNLNEMDQTVARLKEQLRKLEIETEAQILSRFDRGDDGNEEFDPLEFDRFTQLQQISRGLVESVNDVLSLKSQLEDETRETETLLVQQARVNADLQQGLMRTRMVPFSGLVPRLKRILRQTARELGKQAELVVEGAEGELDRTVLERVTAPLEHMVRNAVGHGLESSEDRRLAGKPEQGRLIIHLDRRGGEMVIRVSDDGRGLNMKAVREKAIANGLIKAQSSLSDRDLQQVILEPGFSTAKSLSQLSGRGVGMDVVNSEVKQLGGSLEIDSIEGQGSSFTLYLPLTLAVNSALLAKVGKETYAIPLAALEAVVRLGRRDLERVYSAQTPMYQYGDGSYLMYYLGALVGTSLPEMPDEGQTLPVLMIRTGDQRIALQVDSLLGSREVVVKSLGSYLANISGVGGATILGDGQVVLILEVGTLVRREISPSFQRLAEAVEEPVDEDRPLQIMVVDDSITMRKVATRLLERQGMEVVTAKDGVEALAKLHERLPDVMLLDIEMPRMDGYELAGQMRKDPRFEAVPIIMITSRSGEKHRERAAALKVNRYLGKPYQESDLLRHIAELTDQSGRE